MVTITPRSAAATGLAVVMVLAVMLVVALPARQAFDAKQRAQNQNQELAEQVLIVCQQGGDTAAPLVAIKACPLAEAISSASQSAPSGLTPAEIQALVQREVARQMATRPVMPTPEAAPEGGGPPGPGLAPPVAGRPGRERPIEVEPPRAPEPPTPTAREAPYRYPDQRREPQREVTVTEQAPAPPAVTEQAPAQVAEQPGTPLLNGVGGLLSGLGAGLG
jgi:type II secretory pathway pseudopilin PulG